MTPHLTRGTIVSFDSATYTALVMLDGSVAEVTMPVLETVPANYLAADDEVAVMEKRHGFSLPLSSAATGRRP